MCGDILAVVGESILETGVNQLGAIALHLKIGYVLIPNYGPYAEDSESICTAKSFYRK
jgi:hypothetical protein